MTKALLNFAGSLAAVVGLAGAIWRFPALPAPSELLAWCGVVAAGGALLVAYFVAELLDA